MAIEGLCRSCGMIITYVEPGLDPHYHPTCGPNRDAGPNPLFAEPDGPHPHDEAIARDLDEVILWGHNQSPRSRQLMIGPSELGDACDRKLAYRIAGIAPVNDRLDPWPAWVGTAVHQRLETVINAFQAEAGSTRWLCEQEVYPDDLVVGHCDLYDLETESVWDFKTASTDNLRKFRKEGPLTSYRVQVNLYGLGVSRAGRKVRRVGLVAFPRSGWLSGKWIWSEPYNEDIAKAALSRMYSIADQVLELGLDQRPEQAMAIEPTPSQLCSFCEFYTPNPAGAGCPGK